MTYYLMLTTGSTELGQAIQNGSMLEIQARKWLTFVSNFSQLAFSGLANNLKAIYLIIEVFPFLGAFTFQLDVESSRNQQLTCCRDEYREPRPF